jgi:hypothetical protein
MEETNVTLFYPKTGRDLRIQYPELKSIPEFKNVNSKELLFVWYWSNPTSPIEDDIPFRQRVEACVKMSEWKVSAETLKLLLENSWPENIQKASQRMQVFETMTRNKARKVIKEIFANFEKLVKVNDDDFKLIDKDGEYKGIDFAARKQYVEYGAKIASEMPGLINKLEEGFGTDDGSSEIGSNEKAIDIWHKSK